MVIKNINLSVKSVRKINFKKAALFIAIICILSVMLGTIALYSHYGPITTNGNRYYHQFNVNTVEWRLVFYATVATALLAYPSVRYALSSNFTLHKNGIFPSKDKVGEWISMFLTILCIGSQILYTVSYCLIVNEYLSNHSRVMAEDLETGIQYFAYIGCILFWGFVNIVYSVKYRFKW